MMLWTMLEQNHVSLVYSTLLHIAPKIALAAAMQHEKEASGLRTFVRLLERDVGSNVNIPLQSLLNGITDDTTASGAAEASRAREAAKDALDVAVLIRDVEASSLEALVAAGVCGASPAGAGAASKSKSKSKSKLQSKSATKSATSAPEFRFDERSALLVFLRVFHSIFESTEATDFDSGGLRYLIAARRFQHARALIRECAPPQTSVDANAEILGDLKNGHDDRRFAGSMNAVRTSDCAWALHQGGNEQLVDLIFPPSRDASAPSGTHVAFSWPNLRRVGSMLWLQNHAAIRRLGERLGRVQFRRYGAAAPLECALVYAGTLRNQTTVTFRANPSRNLTHAPQHICWSTQRSASSACSRAFSSAARTSRCARSHRSSRAISKWRRTASRRGRTRSLC